MYVDQIWSLEVDGPSGSHSLWIVPLFLTISRIGFARIQSKYMAYSHKTSGTLIPHVTAP